MAIRALFVLSMALLTAAQQQQPYTHRLTMDAGGKFVLSWRSDADSITFQCEVATRGWIGLGFSPSGGMEDADIVIAYVDQQGSPQLSDRHGPSDGNGYPPLDQLQNIQLISARKNTTHTIVVFSRKLDTCDSQDFKITDDTTRMIWAYNDQLPSSPDDIVQHTARGVHNAHLLTPQVNNGLEKVLRDPSVTKYEMRSKNVRLPASRTLYWCEIIQLPKRSKEHIVANEVIIQPGNERFVHHFVLYSCGSQDMSAYLGKPQPCFDEQQHFSPMRQCGNIQAVWAVGGEAFVYPDNMGAPFFEDGARFFMTEMHYDNPDLQSGIVDSSGFRLYVTPQLRPVETGRLNIGLPVSPVMLLIPPQQKNYTLYAYCPSACTSRLTQPMNIFAGVLHTHLLGVAIRFRVIRKGTEQKSPMQDEHYNFNYQSPLLLNDPLQVLPGDDLIVECVYDTSKQTTPGFGGFATVEEMCLAMLEYYPKRNHTTESCMSFVDPSGMLALVGARNGTFNVPEDGFGGTIINQQNKNVTIADWYKKDVKWNTVNAGKLQEYARNSPQTVMCGFPSSAATADARTSKSNDVLLQLSQAPTNSRPYTERSMCGATTASRTMRGGNNDAAAGGGWQTGNAADIGTASRSSQPNFLEQLRSLLELALNSVRRA